MLFSQSGQYTLFSVYKHAVYKHTQAEIVFFLSTLLSTGPASDSNLIFQYFALLLVKRALLEKNSLLFVKGAWKSIFVLNQSKSTPSFGPFPIIYQILIVFPSCLFLPKSITAPIIHTTSKIIFKMLLLIWFFNCKYVIVSMAID